MTKQSGTSTKWQEAAVGCEMNVYTSRGELKPVESHVSAKSKGTGKTRKPGYSLEWQPENDISSELREVVSIGEDRLNHCGITKVPDRGNF